MAFNMISNTGRAFLCSNNIIEMYQKGTTSFYENGMVNAYHSYVTQTTSPFIFLPKFYRILNFLLHSKIIVDSLCSNFVTYVLKLVTINAVKTCILGKIYEF